jgi:glycosyltransferase involved in cell wall biosynthesis
VRDDGIPPERVHCIPSGFEPGVFAAGEDDPFPDVPRPRVGYVGRLAPQKRAELAVEALAQVRQPATLLVVGDGPDRELVDLTIDRSPVRERIVRHGFVDHTRIPAVLRSLDVLVLPSAYEELGSVLVEAMAVGLPVVASRVGGIPEVVADEVTGLLVEPGDVAGFAAAIDRVLGDPALAKLLSANALARATAYGWPALGARVAALYDDVRSDPGAPDAAPSPEPVTR